MRNWVRVCLVLAIVACTPVENGRTPAPPSPESSLSTLSAEDLTGAEYTDMYQAIQTLRGTWLSKHGPMSIMSERDIVVYLDNTRLGGPATLKTIDAHTVGSARHLSAIEAQSLFGLNHPYGAIVVTTRQEP